MDLPHTWNPKSTVLNRLPYVIGTAGGRAGAPVPELARGLYDALVAGLREVQDTDLGTKQRTEVRMLPWLHDCPR